MDYDGLERLVRLRDQGALSDEEFAAQKMILLAAGDVPRPTKISNAGRLSTYSALQRVSALWFFAGLCGVAFSIFIYDTTISPMDIPSAYSSVTESSSIEDRSQAINEIGSRFERTLSGERIINFPRVETQRQIFACSALLMILGAIGFLIPLRRKNL
jgi:Short C-terminal domain